MTAEQLLNMNQRRMRRVRNTIQGVRKYEITKELPDDYIVLDLNATGFRPGADRIIQIGMVKYKNGKQVDTFQTLINPRRFIPIEVTRTTKITNFLVEDAPFIEDQIEDFLSFIDYLPIVTHNASLHMKFLYALEHIVEIELPVLTVVDTARLARKALSTISQENLDELTMYLHRAHDPEDIMNHCATVNHIYHLCARVL